MKRDVKKYGTNGKRDRQQTRHNPFKLQESLKEPSLCTSCETVYMNNHWALDPDAYQKFVKQADVNWIQCPACQKVAAGYAEGVVTLSGNYLWEHEDEIRRILDNEERKALSRNPMERIIRSRRESNKLVIETTEMKLAEHLGRVLHKSHHGNLDISWTGSPHICRVSWERMD